MQYNNRRPHSGGYVQYNIHTNIDSFYEHQLFLTQRATALTYCTRSLLTVHYTARRFEKRRMTMELVIYGARQFGIKRS